MLTKEDIESLITVIRKKSTKVKVSEDLDSFTFYFETSGGGKLWVDVDCKNQSIFLPIDSDSVKEVYFIDEQALKAFKQLFIKFVHDGKSEIEYDKLYSYEELQKTRKEELEEFNKDLINLLTRL